MTKQMTRSQTTAVQTPYFCKNRVTDSFHFPSQDSRKLCTLTPVERAITTATVRIREDMEDEACEPISRDAKCATKEVGAILALDYMFTAMV
mmetsp:Transcript_10670/g.29437  ORF Transcript_10670/g.29437 Transcript_10670/m.29437 type:complete len:92 (+) Transcript_10670:273-548(+)